MTEENLRIALIDDQEGVRETIREWLGRRDGYCCVGVWDSVENALDRLGWIKPDVLLLDLHLGRSESIDQLSDIRKVIPETAILMLTGEDDYQWIRRALTSGVNGYLLKSSAPAAIPAAIEELRKGGLALSGQVARSLIDRHLVVADSEQLNVLTQRERQILHHMSEGRAYKEIAACLDISHQTVRTHGRNILTKLKVTSATAAVLVYLHATRSVG